MGRVRGMVTSMYGHWSWPRGLTVGPLNGGPQCPMSNLRNGYVTILFNVHIDLRIVSCHMLNLRNSLCYVDSIFSHVNRLHVAC